MYPSEPYRAWAEIDAGALAHNIALLQRRFGPARIMAVVKADAYGHGLSLVAPLCAQAGLTDFGVATPAEGVALRALVPGDAAVYLLGPAFPEEAASIVAHRLTPLVSDWAMGRALSEAAQARGARAEVHLDVDTGIGRAGAQPSDALALLRALDGLPGLSVTGVATHFASADEDPADARAQHFLFQGLLEHLGPRADSLLLHAANSPGALHVPPAARHALVRPGLLLYGIEPTVGDFAAQGTPFRPVLSLRCRVTLCRALPPGSTISYGRTYIVPPEGGTYATLGIGYGDGYSRRLGNVGHVLIRGQRAPICGRVCMDQTVVDVSHIPGVRAGDTATLIGTDGGGAIAAAALAGRGGTTPHEITTALLPRIPRIL